MMKMYVLIGLFFITAHSFLAAVEGITNDLPLHTPSTTTQLEPRRGNNQKLVYTNHKIEAKNKMIQDLQNLHKKREKERNVSLFVQLVLIGAIAFSSLKCDKDSPRADAQHSKIQQHKAHLVQVVSFTAKMILDSFILYQTQQYNEKVYAIKMQYYRDIAKIRSDATRALTENVHKELIQ